MVVSDSYRQSITQFCWPLFPAEPRTPARRLTRDNLNCPITSNQIWPKFKKEFPECYYVSVLSELCFNWELDDASQTLPINWEKSSNVKINALNYRPQDYVTIQRRTVSMGLCHSRTESNLHSNTKQCVLLYTVTLTPLISNYDAFLLFSPLRIF